ncbi:hypothetical protein SELMODRAFT_432509 [Selaginella moellendorffii]|uniref:Methyltransferase n=1 Tax=Selaginella moellendorffii TaxID=88036 RepID=D8TG81_SELML|nr:hypothetical protein SELMODRAFT_432509 [Selaginella moellendorffii]
MSPRVSCSSIAILALVLEILILAESLDHDHRTAFQSCWPDPSAWDTFNSSIDGRLIEVLPPATPCHESDFDEQPCEIVREKWSSPFWRSDQPQSSNWEASGNQSCLISSPPNSSFSQGSVPVYSVNASTPSHVQTVVKFASAKNIHTGRSGTGSGTGDTTALLNVDLWSWELIVDDNNLNFVLHSLLIFSGNL